MNTLYKGLLLCDQSQAYKSFHNAHLFSGMYPECEHDTWHEDHQCCHVWRWFISLTPCHSPMPHPIHLQTRASCSCIKVLFHSWSIAVYLRDHQTNWGSLGGYSVKHGQAIINLCREQSSWNCGSWFFGTFTFWSSYTPTKTFSSQGNVREKSKETGPIHRVKLFKYSEIGIKISWCSESVIKLPGKSEEMHSKQIKRSVFIEGEDDFVAFVRVNNTPILMS